MRFIILIFLVFFSCSSFADVITGEVTKENQRNENIIYDNATNLPIEGVVIRVPAKKIITKTDKNGAFRLKTQIDSPAIMSLEKNGYKPYSMTLAENFKNPIQIGIEKTTPNDIVVDTNMIHLGDDSYSERSANASEFSLLSMGSFYSNDFNVHTYKPDEDLYLVIGSIIGIDTIHAQRLGQSRVISAYASPPEVFINGNRIADIKINGDNQKIKIPKGLIRFNQFNNLTIKAGRNLQKITSIDFDDIEFTNILFEIK